MVIYARKFNSKAIKALAPLLSEDMLVVDVGCSTGYQRIWKEFHPKLALHGFDPLVNEIKRLAAAESNPKIQYHAAFVTPVSMATMPERKRSGEKAPPRRASVVAKLATDFDQVRDQFNSGQEVVFATHGVALDDFFEPIGRGKVNFLKTDTDGRDFQVLCGAKRIIASGGLLGVDIEIHFDGIQNDDANLFRNIDKLLGENGFSLYHLEPKRYAKAALPRPFVNERPTASEHGQYKWADAIYLRDLGAPDYEKKFGLEFSLDQILKTICLFEHFDLPDCAIEVVLKYRDRIETVIDPTLLLNLLTPKIGDVQLTYENYMKQFDKAIELRAFQKFGREIL